jgi:hypothetical protein
MAGIELGIVLPAFRDESSPDARLGSVMLKKEIAVCVLLGLIPSSGLLAAGPTKANWVQVQSKPGRTIYIDANSIRVRGDFKDVWEKTVEDVTAPERVSVSIDLWRYDCAKRRDTMLYLESYLKDGTLVNSAGIPESQREWNDTIPTSTAGRVLKIVCSR